MRIINIWNIILIITWFLIGIATMIAIWISDMRNQEFNKNYFAGAGISFSFLVLFGGYLSFVISIGVYCHIHKPFTRFIYKMANLGVKKNE